MHEHTKNILIFLLIFSLYTSPIPDTDTDQQYQEINGVSNSSSEDSFQATDSKLTTFRMLHGYYLNGAWSTKDFSEIDRKNSILKTFERPGGRIELLFGYFYYQIPAFFRQSQNEPSEVLTMYIHDGEYNDDSYIILILRNVTYDTNRRAVFIKNETETISLVRGFRLQSRRRCPIDATINFSRAILPNGTFSTDEGIMLHINSTECELDIVSTNIAHNFEKMEKRVINYSFLLIMIASVSFYQTAQILRRVIESVHEAYKYSILTIGSITVWDGFICITHLMFAMQMEKEFHLFVMPIFLFFILFAVLDLRLMIIMWKTHLELQANNAENIRRESTSFSIKLYGGLFLSLILFYLFILENTFLLFMTLILVPQIFHNANRTQRVDGSSHYPLFLLAGVKLLLPLYYRGCPYNIMHMRSSPIFITTLFLLLSAQIITIGMQEHYGNKFFVPGFLLPPKYNYLVSFKDEDLESTPLEEICDCAICMNPLNESPSIDPTLSSQALNLFKLLKPRDNQYMQTPCSHKYHVSCLLNWMSIKMECPTCRYQLPSVE